MVRIEVLGTPDCPHLTEALERVQRVTARLGAKVQIQEYCVRDLEDARRLGFPGSPTVRINGQDIEREALGGVPALACRLYAGGGAPPESLVEAALRRALEDR